MTTTADPALLVPLDRLDAAAVGPVLAGGTAAAEREAATFNLAVTHRPAVVVGAACAEDVVAAVRFATAHRLPVAVQATGHGPIVPADGAVLVTTSRMRAVSIDPQARTARAQAGAVWRDVVDAAAVHGLAPLCGSSSQVGVVGYTLGGGIGLLARQYGFAADLVVSVELVTADGARRVVDDRNDPELFWAIRGGKSNFGIVTEIEFELVELTELFTGSIFWDATGDAGALLHAYRQWAPTLPETTTTSIALLRLPPHETLPPPLRGRTVIHLRYAHNGPTDEGSRLLAPMTTVAPALMAVAGPMPFTATDSVHSDPTDPVPVIERTTQLRDLTDETVEAILATAGPSTGAPLAMVEIRQLGGALARRPARPNAVAGREGRYALVTLGVLAPGIEPAVRAAGTAVAAAMAPWTTGTALLNFLGDATTPERVATAWHPDVHARLMRQKHRVDPGNVFRFGHALA